MIRAPDSVVEEEAAYAPVPRASAPAITPTIATVLGRITPPSTMIYAARNGIRVNAESRVVSCPATVQIVLELIVRATRRVGGPTSCSPRPVPKLLNILEIRKSGAVSGHVIARIHVLP